MTPPSDLRKYIVETKMNVLSNLHSMTHKDELEIDECQLSFYEGMLKVLNSVEDFCEKRKRY